MGHWQNEKSKMWKAALAWQQFSQPINVLCLPLRAAEENILIEEHCKSQRMHTETLQTTGLHVVSILEIP